MERRVLLPVHRWRVVVLEMMHLPITGIVSSAPSAKAVVSVEHVSVDLTGTTVTVNLTKGQDYTQCAPFLSYRSRAQSGPTEIYKLSVTAELIDNSGTPAVRFTRYNSSSITFRVECDIVEFHDDISVQALSFTANGNSATQACSVVDLNKSFILGTSSGTSSKGNVNNKTALYKFNSPTQIGIERQGFVSTTLTGVIYVVEDKSAGNDFFSVQTFTGTGSSVANFDAAITSVDTTKTSVIFSHNTSSTELSGQGGGGAWGVLLNATTVRVTLPFTTETRNWEGYAITWKDGSTVQRGTYNRTSNTTNALETITAALSPSVDEARSIAYTTSRHWDVASTVDNNSYNASECKFAFDIAAGGSALNIRHWSTVFAVIHRFGWEVVEFAV